jgi:hypothetical protein
MWRRLGQLVLAPDLAAASNQRMCSGGVEAERACIFDQACSRSYTLSYCRIVLESFRLRAPMPSSRFLFIAR